MHTAKLVSRRRFLLHGAACSMAGFALTRVASGWSAANERIQIGFIGIGKQSRGHLSRFVGYPDVQVVAVCDVETTRRENAQRTVEDAYAKQAGTFKYNGCKAYNDFRELLARDDIDAVLIGTPDHWHAI